LLEDVGRLLGSGGQDLVQVLGRAIEVCAVKACSGSRHQGDSGSYHQSSFGCCLRSGRLSQKLMVLGRRCVAGRSDLFAPFPAGKSGLDSLYAVGRSDLGSLVLDREVRSGVALC